MKNFLFIVDGAIDTVPTIETYRFSTLGYNIGDHYYPADIKETPQLSSSIAGNLQTFGPGEISSGELLVANPNGRYDALLNHGFNRRGELWLGEHDEPFANYVLIIDGIVEKVDAPDLDTIRFRLRDRQEELAQPFQPAKFDGSNSAANGIEGTPSDLQGRVKPRLFGKVRNISPPLLNSTTLIYGFNFDRAGNTVACNAVSEVRDGGLPLQFGADRADLAALQANNPAPGFYDTCLAESLIRLGSTPEFDLTLDATTLRNGLSQMVEDVLTDHPDISVSDVNSADIAQFALDAPYTAGIWIDSETDYRNVLDFVIGSGGGYYLPDENGVYRVTQLKSPTGTPVVEFTEKRWDIPAPGTAARIDDLRVETTNDPGNGVPVDRVVLRFNRNYTPQEGSRLAAAVAADKRVIFAEEWQSRVHEDATIANQFKLPTQLEFDTALTEEGHALTEATRRQNLFGTLRQLFEIDAEVGLQCLCQVRAGALVRVTYSRFGLDNGKLFIVTQAQPNEADFEMTLTIWG